MNKRWIFVGVALTALLAACGTQAPSGGGGDSSVDPRGIGGVLSSANTQLYMVESPLSDVVPAPVLFIPSGLPDADSWDCGSVQVSGNVTDNDRDGIPVDATFNGECTWTYSNITFSWKFQTLRVQDPNDNDAQAGVKVNGTVVWRYSDGTNTITLTWLLTQHDLVKQSDGTYAFDYVGKWTVNDGTDTYTFNYSLQNGTWKPDDISNPWGDGSLTVTGSFSGPNANCAEGWNLNVDLQSLHYVNGSIVAGSATYCGMDCNSQVSVKITWQSDGTPVFDPSFVCPTGQ